MDRNEQEKLFAEHMTFAYRYAVYVWRKMVSNRWRIDVEDIYSESLTGLWQAVLRWNGERSFKAYARHWIKKYVWKCFHSGINRGVHLTYAEWRKRRHNLPDIQFAPLDEEKTEDRYHPPDTMEILSQLRPYMDAKDYKKLISRMSGGVPHKGWKRLARRLKEKVDRHDRAG